jgi:hypothetical protein
MNTADWITAVGTFVGPFVGILGAVWLYAKRRKDDEFRRDEDRRVALILELQAELSANEKIIAKSMASVTAVLDAGGASDDPNDPIYDERFYLAPLFANSWDALRHTNAVQVLTPQRLDQLFAYYSAVARVNWLLGRVQRFKFRRSILQEISRTLDEVEGELGQALDITALAIELTGPRHTPPSTT